MGPWVYVHCHGKKIKGLENKLSENDSTIIVVEH